MLKELCTPKSTLKCWEIFILILPPNHLPRKTLWCKNQENPSDWKSHTWAPLNLRQGPFYPWSFSLGLKQCTFFACPENQGHGWLISPLVCALSPPWPPLPDCLQWHSLLLPWFYHQGMTLWPLSHPSLYPDWKTCSLCHLSWRSRLTRDCPCFLPWYCCFPASMTRWCSCSSTK